MSITRHSLRLDQIDADYYLAVGTQGAGTDDRDINYRVVRIGSRGFTELRLACMEGRDRPIAVAAGATVRADRDYACFFSSYQSLLQAARDVVARHRAGTLRTLDAEYALC